LIRARVVADQLDTVTGRVRLEVGGWCPDISTRVLDVLYDGVQRNNVGGWATEEQQSHGVLGGRRPGDGVWLAGGNLFIKTRLVDRIASGFTNLPKHVSMFA